MLVPVQYQRIMALPDFDSFDLSSFRLKTCTSAPFSRRAEGRCRSRAGPGVLVEYYGMTEGGALDRAQRQPSIPTSSTPSASRCPGHDIRLIDDDGDEVAPGEMGEVVGRSPAMMTGYHGRERRDRATPNGTTRTATATSATAMSGASTRTAS